MCFLSNPYINFQMARVWSPCQSFAIPWRKLDNGQLLFNVSTQRQHFERDVSKILKRKEFDRKKIISSNRNTLEVTIDTVIMLFLGWGKAISKNTFANFIAEHFNESIDFSFILENFQSSQLSPQTGTRISLIFFFQIFTIIFSLFFLVS